MSTDYDMVCDKCKVQMHLGQRMGAGFSFGYGSNDKETVQLQGGFIMDHACCEHNGVYGIRVLISDALEEAAIPPEDYVDLEDHCKEERRKFFEEKP